MTHLLTVTVASTLHALQALGLERLDAQLLLLHVLGRAPTERGWLLAHDSEPLDDAPAAKVQALAQRRLAGEPLAYLTGHQAFFGLDLCVDARVLVPRPDTETLVDWALALARDGQRVLDLGTGSGAIALALKASQPALQVHALDRSTDALDVAQANAQRLRLDVRFHRGCWFDGIGALDETSTRFDIVVANPPYIAAGDAHLPALRHEPAQALCSGVDGLDDIRTIVASAPGHLTRDGWLLLEHGYDQAPTVRDMLHRRGFTQVQSRRDLAGIVRCSGGQWPANAGDNLNPAQHRTRHTAAGGAKTGSS